MTLPTDRPRRTRRGIVTAVVATAAALLTTAGLALTGTAQAATTLKSLADAKGKDVGFALAPNRLSESQYKAVADAEFNLVVAENAMKWDATEPSRNSFSYGSGDQVASYAAGQGKKLYGHTLVWHSQLPNWVKSISSSTDLLSAMRNHIANVAGHYQGKVFAWDVVNEAFDEDGTRRDDSHFQQRIGDSYIEEAFRAARAADPAAKLCINDYNTDAINNKSTAIYNLVRDFKARGVPIDCVGFQSHLIIGQVPSSMQQNLQRFADLGVDVRITELDIRMQTPSDSNKLAQQAADYKRVFQICLAVTRCQGVTVWGITDRYSWVPDTFPGQGAALIWDENYNKKPAYNAIVDAFGGPIDPSPTVTATSSPTTPPPPGGCQVIYQVNQWNTGFTGNITVINNGSSTVNGWTMTWTFTAGQTITQAWSSRYTQSGSQATFRNETWNPTIPANGGRVDFGFNANHNGSNPTPSNIALNGTPCQVA